MSTTFSGIPMRRNVLIFHSGALGDFVLTWPLALAAGRLFAQSRVVYVTASQKGALAERALRLESIDIETGGWHTLFSDAPSVDARAQKWLDSAQLIITFLSADGDQWSRSIRKLAPNAQLCFLQSKDSELASPPMHVTDRFAAQLRSNPALYVGMEQMLRSIRSRGVGGIRENPAGPILIHPGSGAARKCWPIEKFIELAKRCGKSGRQVVVVIGEVEREHLLKSALDQLRSVARVIEPATYVELFNEIQKANCFVGNDTGPTHLAAISGVKTVALFGTNPAEWQPIGPLVSIVHRDTIDQIEVDAVIDAMGI